MRDRSLNLYCKAVVVSTFILIVAGGLVTSTGSGLSVPDWPLSYGKFFPPMIGGIRFEHTHRVIAGLVAVMTGVMTAALFKFEKRRWVRNLGLIAFLSVLLQALLGGLTVIFFLPTWISVVHACLAQTFFTMVVVIAWVTSSFWKNSSPFLAEPKECASLKRLSVATTAFITLQLVLGALVRHTQGSGITAHALVAFLIALHIFLLIRKTASGNFDGNLLTHGFLLGALTLTQVFLGIGAYALKWVLPPVETPRPGQIFLTAAHQSNGALLLAAVVIFTLRAFRQGVRE